MITTWLPSSKRPTITLTMYDKDSLIIPIRRAAHVRAAQASCAARWVRFFASAQNDRVVLCVKGGRMASSSSALLRFQSACVTCARGGQRFFRRYRDFLLDPGTLFTLASLLLLIAATIQTPDGLVNSADAHTWLYLAAALVGSVYIWWSAIQGIRQRDFTADIPVSFATAAALIIGQYSAAAVVAVLLLLGGMLEEFVSARASNALDSLAKLLPDRVTVRRDGEDHVVPLEEVQSGDLVLIRSGDRIPVDGVVAQ